MNDINRLMLAVAITIYGYGVYPASWEIIGFVAFLLIAMGSESVRQLRELRETFEW